MKTKEELNAIKEEVENPNKKLKFQAILEK